MAVFSCVLFRPVVDRLARFGRPVACRPGAGRAEAGSNRESRSNLLRHRGQRPRLQRVRSSSALAIRRDALAGVDWRICACLSERYTQFRRRNPTRRHGATALLAADVAAAPLIPMCAKKAASKKPTAKARDLKPKKDAKGGPVFIKIGDIKGAR